MKALRREDMKGLTTGDVAAALKAEPLDLSISPTEMIHAPATRRCNALHALGGLRCEREYGHAGDHETAIPTEPVPSHCACGRTCPSDRSFCCRECMRATGKHHSNSCNRILKSRIRSFKQPGRYRTLILTGRDVRYYSWKKRDGSIGYALEVERSNGRRCRWSYVSKASALDSMARMQAHFRQVSSDQEYDAFIDDIDARVREKLEASK